MSDHNENKITVCTASLPQTLRNLSPSDALDDARDLIHLLKDFAQSMATTESIPDPGTCSGAALVCDLLEDKIGIAAGWLPSFSLSYNGGPTFTEILEAGQKALQEKEGR